MSSAKKAGADPVEFVLVTYAEPFPSENKLHPTQSLTRSMFSIEIGPLEGEASPLSRPGSALETPLYKTQHSLCYRSTRAAAQNHITATTHLLLIACKTALRGACAHEESPMCDCATSTSLCFSDFSSRDLGSCFLLDDCEKEGWSLW